MSRFLHQPLAGAPYEPYGGPPGRLDVADLVTTANSSSIAAGLCIAEGGPLVYRVDYDAVVIALDHDLVWEDASGPQKLTPGDIVWLPNGAQNSYWSTATSHFFYTTWPVNWAQIVGWQAGRDVKDLANQGGPKGSFAGIGVHRAADAVFHPFAADGGGITLAPVLGPDDGVSMAAGLIALESAATTLTLQWDAALVALDDNLRLEVDGIGTTVAAGGLLWLPEGTTATLGSSGKACVGYVFAPVDWAARIGWRPGIDRS
ncbi:MAG: hypothetical protein O3B22_07780 [Proteobacteria bacterium]|nr:hypothetical protein [Pseudomonadota bacterium]MDA1070929.1 hypothetical protein [Pseudomonadota bacterium]